MPKPLTWQKSSYCPEGNSCVHVAATPAAIHITESGDPTASILTTTPATFAALLNSLKTGAPTPLEITVTDHGTVHLHDPATPHVSVTTDRTRWNAFVLGVRAGEFDHFAHATP
ncbi:DUF397 domain-containing protein [Streptomyces sp. NPDC002144]|uniref:DUF397 domain-containing protein n=1 Tax=Streptomyces sp. NPDC006668 TaxID=3156903 RepID=UPI0033C092EB